MNSDKAEIMAVIEAVDRAHHDKDAAAIGAGYAANAVIADLAPPLAHTGIDPAQTQAWLDTWEGPIERRSHGFTIEVGGDLAFCHGFYQLAGTSRPAGGQRISFWMRATVCLWRTDGRWKIVHEHESVPFYMDGITRPAFDLEP